MKYGLTINFTALEVNFGPCEEESKNKTAISPIQFEENPKCKDVFLTTEISKFKGTSGRPYNTIHRM